MPESEEGVNAAVREGATRLAGLGAVVDGLSLPVHAIGRAIWTPTLVEGLVDLVMRHDACGTNQRGLFVNGLSDAHGRWRAHADELSPSTKTVLLAGEFLARQYGGRFYGKSQNLIRGMRASYDEALQRYDLLADADHAAEGDGAAAEGRADRGDLRPRARDEPQHRAVLRDRPSRDLATLRHQRGPADRPDADRPPLRGGARLPRRARARERIPRGLTALALAAARRGRGQLA